jgi:translation initiation factor IF-2
MHFAQVLVVVIVGAAMPIKKKPSARSGTGGGYKAMKAIVEKLEKQKEKTEREKAEAEKETAEAKKKCKQAEQEKENVEKEKTELEEKGKAMERMLEEERTRRAELVEIQVQKKLSWMKHGPK